MDLKDFIDIVGLIITILGIPMTLCLAYITLDK